MLITVHLATNMTNAGSAVISICKCSSADEDFIILHACTIKPSYHANVALCIVWPTPSAKSACYEQTDEQILHDPSDIHTTVSILR